MNLLRKLVRACEADGLPAALLPASKFNAAADRAPADVPSGKLARRRRALLVVEDNPSTRTLLVYLLKKEYEVTAAGSVDQALGLVREQTFDGLVLDINLCENRTGVDLLHAIRALPRYENVPAIACTAYTRWGDREHLLSEGFDGYVGKPFTKEQLHQAVHRLFEQPTPLPGTPFQA